MSNSEPKSWSRLAITQAFQILDETRRLIRSDVENGREVNRDKHVYHVASCHNLFNVPYRDDTMSEVRGYISYLGAISKKRKKSKAKKKADKKQKAVQLPKREKIEGFVLSKDLLDDIACGAVKVPNDARPDQIKIIREYVTRFAGFDPKKILLGINSHMEH